MSRRLLIYGANGYTGELISRAAVAAGLAPVLAGRSAGPVGALAAELGCEARVFTLEDPATVAAALAGADVVLHCAGPFSATAAPMIDGCLAAGAHYLDITGEVAVFELAASLDDRARAAGIVLCPGAGFDVVPTDCVALSLSLALPDATHLSLGFDSRSALSRGTASTTVESLGHGSLVREDGALRPIPIGSRLRRIDFGAGEKLATAIPWGDVSTAFHTTGIPNIEVYVPVSPKAAARLRWLDRIGWLLRLAPVQSLLKRRIRAGRPGPTAEERARTPVHVWGEARNPAGRTLTARLRVPNGYTVTADAAIAVARRLMDGPVETGYTTPARLMGPQFAGSLPGATGIHIE